MKYLALILSLAATPVWAQNEPQEWIGPLNIPSGVSSVIGLDMTFNTAEPRDLCVIQAQGECVVEYVAEGNIVRFPKGLSISVKRLEPK